MSTDNTVIQAAPVPDGQGTGNHTGQDPLPEGTHLEGLEIREVIGVGGFGVVYKAWDPMLERLVALKEYLPASLALRMPCGVVKVRDERHAATYSIGLRSFVNEARLLAQFDHAALVKVYRFWEMQGTAYMVMPLYQGVTLKQHVAQRPELLTEQALLNWLVALTEALETMHAQHCYHRDISPENIIIQEATGLPILLDFGAARRVIGNISQPFTVILKASYAPIEQYAEVPSMSQGPWTDVYALAAVAHFLMTGKTPPSSVSRMVNDNYVPLETLDDLPFNKCIKKAVDRALVVQPEDRTASMAQFRDALLLTPNPAPIATGKSLDLNSQCPSQQTSRKASSRISNWAKAMVAIVLLLVLIAGGVAWTINSDKTSQKAVNKAVQVVEEPKQNPVTLEPNNAPDPISPLFQTVLAKSVSPLSIHMDNTVLKIGEDLLRFQVESPFSGHVAVYVLSSDHSLIQLLPNARLHSLPIEAGKKLTLPPANEPIQAAGPAGNNQFLVVVTEEPRTYAHLNMQDHYGFGWIPLEHENLEGIGSCTASPCQDRLAAAWFSVDEVD